jgi:hypothetical protein
MEFRYRWLHVAVLLLPVLASAQTSYDVFNPHPDVTRTSDGKWGLHDKARPLPPPAAPKSERELAARAAPPAGAIVLFSGSDLNAWKPSRWKVENGYVEITPKSGALETREGFGSCKLHLEWWTPPESPKDGQNRGNSGVFLMSTYEIQVLDTYRNETYADGVAAALYGVKPPDFNALRPPGEWQYYDIEFHRPRFDAQGKLIQPARVTVDVNGVRVQDNVPFDGPSSHKKRVPYRAHPDKLPLRLQDHNEVVRFRNIWLLPIEDRPDDKSSLPSGKS